MKPVTHEIDKAKLILPKPKGPRSARIRSVPKTGPFLELFQKEDCPYSHSVRRALSKLGMDFIAHNVTEGHDLQHKTLIDAGGKDQIPFLHDFRTGIKLYDCDAILSYLEKEYSHKKTPVFSERISKASTRIQGRIDQWSWRLRIPRDKLGDQIANLKQTMRWIRNSLRSTA